MRIEWSCERSVSGHARSCPYPPSATPAGTGQDLSEFGLHHRFVGERGGLHFFACNCFNISPVL